MSLADYANKKDVVKAMDVFDETKDIDRELVEKYYEINERKKADEKWLKANKPAIEKALDLLNRDKLDVGSLRVTVAVPDTSHFDEDKVLEYIKDVLDPLDYYACTRTVLSENEFEILIKNGKIDVDKLKKVAWVESKGTPRLVINKVKSDV
jgi:hypothetical protein